MTLLFHSHVAGTTASHWMSGNRVGNEKSRTDTTYKRQETRDGAGGTAILANSIYQYV